MYRGDMIKCRVCDFATYGLNRHRNFLESEQLNFDNTEELLEFMGESLIDHGCPCSAVFAIGYDDNMYTGFMSADIGDYGEIFYGNKEKFDLDYFASLDGELRFCCYALLIEIRPGIWRVVE